MHVYGELTGTLTSSGTLTGNLSASGNISGQLTVPQYILPPSYQGATEITPSEETQVLETGSLYLEDDIVIQPIPSNYGRITYNGSIIKVS